MNAAMIWEHFIMVLSAVLISIALGIPLGLLSYLNPAARKVILRVVDLIQTTPALALLGIIMVFMGAGKPTVVLGLALYSLLPIVRNIVLGLDQVSPSVKEAAKGMGMSRLYSLLQVELPLAMPMLFTGVRIAAVNAIGTAVFAASVGGGGIGGVINTGIRRRDMVMILSGTGALMVMALGLDLVMGWAERRINQRTSSAKPRHFHIPARWITVPGLCLCVLVVVYSLMPAKSEGLFLYDGQFSETQLVCSMVKQLVEDRTDLTVTIGDEMTSVNNFNELAAPDPSCDIMYSWDGTILTTFLHQDVDAIPEGMTLYEYVNEQITDSYGVRMLEKIGVDNTYAIGVTQELADLYDLSTISDLIPISSQLSFGAEQDFFTAAGSMKYDPFVAFYGLNFKKAIPVDIMLKYNAVEQGEYQVMIVYATDGLNKRANLTVLEDDRSFFPEYNGVLVVRRGLFEDYAETAPELEDILNLLGGLFTNERMTDLTYRVDVLGEQVDVVAKDFLVEEGLL